MYKVMIIEDDIKLRTLTDAYLNKWGFQTILVEDFESIDRQYVREKPHIILLDINLPSFDGFYWCSKLRQLSDVPIIFISSRTDNMDIIMAMNMGGDDFIEKPFSLEVLVAKMNAILRRTQNVQQSDRDVISVGQLILNLDNHRLFYQHKEVYLTKNEFHILYLLMKHNGQIVSREKIMRALWQDEQFIDDNTLTVNVTRLRKKLESIGLTESITTKKGQGYVLQ
ncbi:response regulator transcription factor [Heyndrickxia sp. NPDC080065]|uniref:response regulator transcription factor n=1 Tax=Heyndrickxia sp. NPDC080065 TaxID=3390568 RepID=UPI003D064419